MSIQPLIFKNGVYTLPRSAADIEALKVTLGISTSNFVDVSSNQAINGVKIFSGGIQLPTVSGTTSGTIWRNGNNLEYRDGSNPSLTKILLNSAGNLSNLMDKQVALNNLVNGQVANRVLRSDGTNVTLAQVNLGTDVTNTLAIANGGTGSSTQNFVDLTTAQTITGSKYLSSSLSVGVNSSLLASSYNNTNIQTYNALGAVNLFGGSLLPNASIPGAVAFYLTDVEINASNISTIATGIGQQYRVRNFGTGLITSLQGVRLTAANSSTGGITNLDAAYFLAANSSTGTVTTLTGGQFLASVNGGTATTVNGAVFTISAVAGSSVTTARGIHIVASTSNTTPANDCIGLDIASITGTATNKFAIRTGTGQVSFGDTVTTTGIVRVQSAAPGFWLDETDHTQKGAYLLIDGGVFQLQRRTTNFGAFEAIIAQINLVTGVTNLNVNVATTSTTTGTLIVAGGAGFGGTIAANLPTSPTGLAAGCFWRNGNVVNIV